MTNLLLVTSNGTGMGHLTRQAAVALATGEGNNATVFSLSLGLPLVVDLGVRGEYCPSYDRPWIAAADWHAYLRERLIAIVEETGSTAVVFDGVAPYPGLTGAATVLRDTGFVWLRRGMWQRGANKAQLKKARSFDLIIEPGDLAAGADAGPTARRGDAVTVSPISILEVMDLLPRAEARAALGLPAGGPVALVTLGSGRLGDVAGPGRVAVETLLEQAPQWHIAVTRSPVAQNEIPVDRAARLTEIRDTYPLARFLAAFDLAVSSAGYNAVHEMIPAGLPTLLVANTSTRTDDQVARATQLERLDLALAARDDDPEGVADKLESMLHRIDLESLASRAAATSARMRGAREVSAAAIRLAEGPKTRRRSPATVLSKTVANAKEEVKGALGPERTESLKRMLGRHPGPTHARTEVRIADGFGHADQTLPMDLAFTSDVSGADLTLPVEHIVAGSSDDYRRRRREIIDEFYDVVD